MISPTARPSEHQHPGRLLLGLVGIVLAGRRAAGRAGGECACAGGMRPGVCAAPRHPDWGCG